MGEPNDFDDYVDTIADIKPDVPDTNDNTPDDGGTQPSTFLDDKTADKAAPNKDASDNAQTAKNKQDPTQDQQPTKDGQTPKTDQLRPLAGGLLVNQAGDIVNKEGNIVARSGAESRLYINLHKSRAEVENMRNENATLKTQVAEARVLNDMPRQLNLSNDDVAAALDMAAKVRQGKVVEVGKEIIALLMSQGHNITDILGDDVGNSVEMRAMKAMLDERLAPITQGQKNIEKNTEVEQAARHKYEQFVETHEYADLHANEIVHIMNSQGATPEQAYIILNRVIYANGLDISKPLDPQIAARQQQPTTPTPTSRSAPLPHGGRTGTAPAATSRAAQMASADDDWGSIIRTAIETSM